MGEIVTRFGWGTGWLLAGYLLLACGPTMVTGAAASDLVTAGDRAPRGARLFADGCSHCHGQRGEGLVGVPEILGPSALPEYPRAPTVATGFAFEDPQELEIRQRTHPSGQAVRSPFRTAQDLNVYLESHAPEMRVRTLKDEDRWALVSFIVAAQGVDIPSQGVDAENAASLPVRRAR
jgi:hypothetical protein